MKTIRVITVILFLLVLLTPAFLFNTKADVTSEIDNRKLAEYPFSEAERAKGGNVVEKIERYINDRIGLRDEMILSYTVLNDRLFGEMVHPTYCYGKEKHVYFKNMDSPKYGNYMKSFADMIKSMQDYCEARGVTFLFAFEPMKNSVVPEYLPVGVNYENTWVDRLFSDLEKRGVHYVNNTVTLRERTLAGETVYNKKYDVGHWNDLGAYYGVNAMLSALHESRPAIQPNDIGEFTVSEVLETTLSVSQFPINEYVPQITLPLNSIEDLTGVYRGEMEISPSYRSFSYTRNTNHSDDDLRVLIFQGSFMNGKGIKYLQYALDECVAIHAYVNVTDFTYYFNLFKPDVVIFETAENAVNKKFYPPELIAEMQFNPPEKTVEQGAKSIRKEVLAPGTVTVETGESLVKIVWTDDAYTPDCVWALLGEEAYDMRARNGVYEVTVMKDVWDSCGSQLGIAAKTGDTFCLLEAA